ANWGTQRLPALHTGEDSGTRRPVFCSQFQPEVSLNTMHYPFQTITDLKQSRASIQGRRYGVIEIEQGQLQAIHFRPWPKMISRVEIATLGRWKHAHAVGDSCKLYYNVPLGTSGYINLAYVSSTKQTTLKTVRRAAEVLDRIAEIRKADAVVCELSNARISERLLQRCGWESHCHSQAGRHFIKRFYGIYPQHAWLENTRTVLDSEILLASGLSSDKTALPC
ncbi:MAG: hypothetical protein COA78_31380, partial [Blastopirellula sp.]